MKANQKIKMFMGDHRGIVFELLISAGFAVIFLFALINVGTFINGTMGSSLTDSFGPAGLRTRLENKTVFMLSNITDKFEDNIDILSVGAIITVMTVPLAALVAIRKIF